ncbi:MAG: DNA repair protein RadC [Sphaerochaetaceae bacterium]|jgi:DNA repair protein RadC|nr:DNA repair protein RadC [Sphaerochaetaceae bacterium]
MNYQFSFKDNVKSIRELPPDERPRERLQNEGAMSLSDLELLCILIGSGTKGRPVQSLASDLQALLARSAAPSVPELCSISGLGTAKASVICAALELGRRLNFSSRKQIRSPGDAFPLIRHYGDREQEHFITILLNGAHEVFSIKVVTVGLLNKTLVHPREVFSDPIRERACAVILAHNHPSGSLDPSEEDLAVTSEMVTAGRLLGIKVLDHLVFSSEDYVSLMESGLMHS